MTKALQDLFTKLRRVLYAATAAATEWARQKATDIDANGASSGPASGRYQDLLADSERWEPARLVPSWVDRKAYFELIAAGAEEEGPRAEECWRPWYQCVLMQRVTGMVMLMAA